MKILIIENNVEDARKYEESLSSKGFQVHHAKGGIEGIKKLNEDTYNLILLNIMLPDMHGLNFIKTIRNHFPDNKAPMVILTECADDQVIEEAYKLHISGYLVKPDYTPEQIAEYVKGALYINK